MKNIFIYEGFYNKKIESKISFSKDGDIFLNASEDSLAEERFFSRYQFKQADSFFDAQELKNLVKKARDDSSKLVFSLKDAFQYDNALLLENVFEYDISNIYMETLRNVLLLNNLKIKEEDFNIIIYKSNSILFHCCEIFCKQQGIKLLVLDREIKDCCVKKKNNFSFNKVILVKITKLLCSFNRNKELKKYQNRVLITDYFRFQPLIKELKRNCNFKIFFLKKKKDIVDFLDKEDNFSVVILACYLPLSKLFSVKKKTKSILRKVKESFIDKPLVFQNTQLNSLLRLFVSELASRLLEEYILFYEAVKTLLEIERIDTVISNQDVHGYNKVLALTANYKKIKTVCFQHGMYPNVEVPEHSKYISKKVFLWGEREKEIYFKRNMAPDSEICLVGDPFLKQFYIRNTNKNRTFSNLNLNPEKKTILMSCEKFVNIFMPYVAPITGNRNLNLVISTVKEMRDCQLIIRMKPKDSYLSSYKFKENIISQYSSDNIYVNSKSNIYDLLSISDVVIVTLSTIGLESMLFKKPLIVLNLGGKEDPLGYVSAGSARPVFKEHELLFVLNSLLFDSNEIEKMISNQQIFLKNNFINLQDNDHLARCFDELQNKPYFN